MDATFVIQKEENEQNLLWHINSFDLAMQFTVENNMEDGAIPFLDTIVKPEADGNLSITVYRKPAYTDQYWQWDNHLHLSAKYSVISTLTHLAKTVCNNPELLQKEMEHLRKALTNFKYPKWALDKVEKRCTRSSSEVNDGANSQGTAGIQPVTNEVKTKGHIVIPYTQGPCESIKKICGRYDIQTNFKGNSTMKNLLVSPKDKDTMVIKIWDHILVPVQRPYLQWLIYRGTSRTIGEDSKNTLRNPPLYIIIAITHAILPLNITSK